MEIQKSQKIKEHHSSCGKERSEIANVTEASRKTQASRCAVDMAIQETSLERAGAVEAEVSELGSRKGGAGKRWRRSHTHSLLQVRSREAVDGVWRDLLDVREDCIFLKE